MPHKATQQPVVVELPAWGVFVFESHHAANFRMEVSRHEALEVFYVLGGAGVFELETKPLRCMSGDVVVVPVGHRHRITDDPVQPLSLHGVRIRPDVWKADPGLELLLPAGRLPRDEIGSLQVRAEFRRLLFEQTSRRPGCGAMMAGLALELLVLLARHRGRIPNQNASPPRATSSMRETVEGYIAELEHQFFAPAKIDHIAKQLGMSRRRFTDLFRDATGTTWADHVRQLRVDHSKHLLMATDRSVASVAFESGFEDLSSFYRAFQRQEGISPHRWRQEQTESQVSVGVGKKISPARKVSRRK
jgi:AraC family L-rhamnose operon regulatory protein RhaS